MGIERLYPLLRRGLHHHAPTALERTLKQGRQHPLDRLPMQMVKQNFGHRMPGIMSPPLSLLLVVIRDQLIEQPYAKARAPALVDVVLRRAHAGAGNVEMCPWSLLDKT